MASTRNREKVGSCVLPNEPSPKDCQLFQLDVLAALQRGCPCTLPPSDTPLYMHAMTAIGSYVGAGGSVNIEHDARDNSTVAYAL